MASRIPQLRCAVLCTPDGFNLCSLGLTEDQVGKMAALSSSLLSVGDATVASLLPEGSPSTGLEMMTMEANGVQFVSTKIKRPSGGDLVLLAGAATALGVVLVGVRAAVADLQQRM